MMLNFSGIDKMNEIKKYELISDKFLLNIKITYKDKFKKDRLIHIYWAYFY